MAQGQFTYTLTVESRQYRRELANASKLANELTRTIGKSAKAQRDAFRAASEEVQRTQRRYNNLANAVKAFPNIADRTKDREFFKQLQTEAKGAKVAFKDASKELTSYVRTLKQLSELDVKQIRRAQVQSDVGGAQKNLARQNRANTATADTIRRVSLELGRATQKQREFVNAGLDTAKVDLQIANLTIKHAKLNEALNRGVKNARNLEKELKAVADQEGRLGRTQYSRPIGPAAPKRGFGGNTGTRAAIGGRMSKMGGSAGAAGAALTGGIAGLAAAAASQAVDAVMALGRAVGQYASDAARAAAETTRMRRALAGVLGAEAPEAFESIKRVVKDFNVPLQDATTNFTRFAASAKSSGVDAVDIEKSFRGLIAANKALGGSQEQANGILLAATQVFGKGKVAAEELRGQIAERLPGAVALFAKSMGLTTAELDKRLEEGTVSVADFVKFTGELLQQFEEDAKAISRGPEEAGQRLEVALDLLQRNIGTLLAPIGAAFQTTFALIVGAINTGIEAMNRFLGLTPEAALDKAQSALEARQRDLTNAIKGEGKLVDIGMQGSGRRQTESEARAELDEAIKALDKARKVVGTGKGSIEKDKMVTAEDLINNRRGKGRARSTGKSEAQRTAEQMAKIMSANERRLAEENARQATATLKARYALQRQLEEANQNHIAQGLHGGRRLMQEIYNSFTAQISALQDQGKQLEDAVSQAEARVEAAKAELATATTGPDQERAQGRVDMETAKLAGARQRSADFESKSGDLATFAFADMLSASTADFRERAYQLKTETEELKLRNRLMMEGFSPEMIDMQLEQAEIDRTRNEQLAQLSELQKAGGINAELYAAKLKEINLAADSAKDAVEALTQAQIAAADPIKNYIATAQEYISNTRERLGEMLATVDQALAASIEGVVTGTMTIGQAFQSFFQSIGQAFLKMAAQMIAKLIIIKLLKTALGMMGGSVAPDVGDAMDGGGVLPEIAMPGEMPFAKGGIVTRPTRALIGEGGMNEAVVPLPNGRSIPVDLGKGGAGQMTNNTTVTVNVDNSGGATSDVQGDDAGKLGQAIDGAIRKVIMEERRSGGLLYTGGR